MVQGAMHTRNGLCRNEAKEIADEELTVYDGSKPLASQGGSSTGSLGSFQERIEREPMTVTCDRQRTEARLLALEQYLTTNILGADFVCPDYRVCRSSHAEAFYEGQLHHVGQFYDLLLDDLPLRVVVVVQEYGHEPPRVGCQARYDMIMSSGLDYRFKAGGGYKARNPHMRGTTNVLRLLFGIPLGTDHDSEFMMIEGKRIHIFDAFALVNYLLCSAVSTDGKMRGLATRTMMKNCQGHFREVMRILEPSVVIVQGTTFWAWVSAAFDSVTQKTDHVYRARLGRAETSVAVFTHPSAHFPHNWGANDQTPYLVETVAPSIASIRQQLRRVL